MLVDLYVVWSGIMWKKVLAILSIPFAALLSFAAVWSTFITFAVGPSQGGAYGVFFYVGVALAMGLTGGVLFFLWRWIRRVLWNAGGSRS